jgi:hypothetical protein
MALRNRLLAFALCCLGAFACAGPEPAPRTPGPAAERPEPAEAADPVAAYALRAEANVAYDAKDYGRCAAILERAVAKAPADADIIRYDQACCHALAGDKEAALGALEGAVARGFRNPSGLERDDDLKGLREGPRWARLLEGAAANHEAYLKGANRELRRIHEDDQADRRPGPNGINWAEVTPRDEARRRRVREILEAGGAKVSADYYHAAMVYQHGGEVADFRRSHELAERAVELDPANRQAKWLAAASKDRELMNLGQPQLYGTQFRKVDGRWELYRVDPSVSDDERRRRNVPPLAEAKRRADAMNAGP